MIEGMRQAVEYGSSGWRLYVRLRHEGSDLPQADMDATNPTISINDPDGNELVSETNLTQDVGAVWYYDVDVSDTGAWAKGLDYRAKITYAVDSGAREFHEYVYFDVAAYPFNNPLVTSEEIATRRPGWDLPGDWTDWSEAIEEGHADLTTDLLNLRDNYGERIYPFRVIDRQQLRKAAWYYCLRACARIIRLSDQEMQDIMEHASNVLPTLIHLDRDDELDKESSEEASQSVMLIR